MRDDFNANRWLYWTGRQMHRSGTAAGVNLFDAYILRRHAKGRRRHRMWPWVVASLIWLALPGWIELSVTALTVGGAVWAWLTCRPEITRARWTEAARRRFPGHEN